MLSRLIISMTWFSKRKCQEFGRLFRRGGWLRFRISDGSNCVRAVQNSGKRTARVEHYITDKYYLWPSVLVVAVPRLKGCGLESTETACYGDDLGPPRTLMIKYIQCDLANVVWSIQGTECREDPWFTALNHRSLTPNAQCVLACASVP